MCHKSSTPIVGRLITKMPIFLAHLSYSDMLLLSKVRNLVKFGLLVSLILVSHWALSQSKPGVGCNDEYRNGYKNEGYDEGYEEGYEIMWPSLSQPEHILVPLILVPLRLAKGRDTRMRGWLGCAYKSLTFLFFPGLEHATVPFTKPLARGFVACSVALANQIVGNFSSRL